MYSQWGEFAGSTHETAWGVSLNGSYAYGPGISFEAQVAYTKASYGNFPFPLLTPASAHSFELDVGTAINF
jgi:hypothetical protein